MDYQRNTSLTKLEDDVKQVKDDVRTIKQDLKRLIAQSNATGRSDKRDADPMFLQHWASRSPRHLGTPDMLSDTASTASTGSEDENAKQHLLLTKCMAEAIQRHFIELVRCVPFDGVVDDILTHGIVTVQENKRIREFSADDDKMRFLVRNVMSKDYKTMMKFLSLINEYDPYLRNAIRSTFDIRHRDGLPGLSIKTCTVCLMKKRINIKVVGDQFFARELVSNELHRDITDSASTEGQADLWRRLFEELSDERPEYIMHVMKDILKDGEGELVAHYEDIIQSIDKDIKRHTRSLKCRCLSGNKRSTSPLSQNDNRSVKQRRGSNNPFSVSPGFSSFDTQNNVPTPPPYNPYMPFPSSSTISTSTLSPTFNGHNNVLSRNTVPSPTVHVSSPTPSSRVSVLTSPVPSAYIAPFTKFTIPPCPSPPPIHDSPSNVIVIP